MRIELKKISDLKPAPYNPRQATKKDEFHLSNSLKKFGMVDTIIFNERSGYIVGGHFRIRELIKLGYKEVYCSIVDLDEKDERELNIRLNANVGSFDYDELGNNWDIDELKKYGLNIDYDPQPFEIETEPLKENTIKVTFKTPEDVQRAESEIQDMLDREYDGAYLSINL